MVKWEYKYINIWAKEKKEEGFECPERLMNKLGKEGWELVKILQFNLHGTDVHAIFKRELK
jgi:hypothetical protein